MSTTKQIITCRLAKERHDCDSIWQRFYDVQFFVVMEDLEERRMGYTSRFEITYMVQPRDTLIQLSDHSAVLVALDASEENKLWLRSLSAGKPYSLGSAD